MHTNTRSPHAVAILIIAPEGTPLVRDPKKPAPQYWKLPGGNSTETETPEACAVREVWEETGLRIDEDDLEVLEQQERATHTMTFFKVHVPSLHDLRTEGDEREEIKVFPSLIEIGKMEDLFPNHRPVVQKAAIAEM